MPSYSTHLGTKHNPCVTAGGRFLFSTNKRGAFPTPGLRLPLAGSAVALCCSDGGLFGWLGGRTCLRLMVDPGNDSRLSVQNGDRYRSRAPYIDI